MNLFEKIKSDGGNYFQTEFGFVFHSPDLNVENQKTAFFGGWKWVNAEANLQFLQQIQNWALQQDCKVLVGPYDFSTYFSYRLKIDNFHLACFAGEPCNQKQDVELLENFGFKVLQTYETYHFENLQNLAQQANEQFKGIENVLQSNRLGIQLASLIDIQSDLENFHELSHQIFQDNFLYNQISFETFRHYFDKHIAQQACWETTVFLIDLDTKKKVGYCLNFRDPSFPDHMLIKSVGVLPRFRFMGSSFLGLFKGALNFSRRTDKKVSFCLMKSGNFPSLLAQKTSVQKQQYALFIKKLI